MRDRISIIAIGLSSAWDITCRGRNIDWGWPEKRTWTQALQEIKATVKQV